MADLIIQEELELLDKTIEKIKRPELGKILKVQQTILRAVDEYMYDNDVTRMLPLMMAPITDTLNHSVEETALFYNDQQFDVMKSMIFHKQITLMNEGIDKVYIVSPNIRLELPERNDVRHLFEFTQVDFELKDASMEDVLAFVEGLFSHIFSVLREKCSDIIEEIAGSTEHLNVTAPFARYRTEELEAKYGAEFEQIASEKATQPFFLINHKREFYDAEDLNKMGTYKNYDVIWPYGFVEGLSGGEREYLLDRILVRMDELDTDKNAFRNYIELAQRGLLPKTAGAGFGVERMTRFVLKLKDINDVTVFNRKPGMAPYMF